MMRLVEQNVETGEIVERDMTPQELAQWEIDKANFQAEEQARIEKAAARQALLARLGLTEEEAKLLLS